MRPITIGISGLLLITMSCDGPNSVVEDVIPDASTIQGRIIGWNMSDSMTIRASAVLRPSSTWDVFASSRVSSDGSFLLALSDPPLATQMPWEYHNDSVSDTSARFVVLWLLDLSGPSRTNICWAYNSNMSSGTYSTPGYFDSFPVYADRPARVRGVDTLISDPGNGLPLDTLLEVRDGQFTKGWNRIVRRGASLREHLMAYVWRIENARTPNWYLQHEQGDEKPIRSSFTFKSGVIRQ